MTFRRAISIYTLFLSLSFSLTPALSFSLSSFNYIFLMLPLSISFYVPSIFSFSHSLCFLSLVLSFVNDYLILNTSFLTPSLSFSLCVSVNLSLFVLYILSLNLSFSPSFLHSLIHILIFSLSPKHSLFSYSFSISLTLPLSLFQWNDRLLACLWQFLFHENNNNLLSLLCLSKTAFVGN